MSDSKISLSIYLRDDINHTKKKNKIGKHQNKYEKIEHENILKRYKNYDCKKKDYSIYTINQKKKKGIQNQCSMRKPNLSFMKSIQKTSSHEKMLFEVSDNITSYKPSYQIPNKNIKPIASRKPFRRRGEIAEILKNYRNLKSITWRDKKDKLPFPNNVLYMHSENEFHENVFSPSAVLGIKFIPYTLFQSSNYNSLKSSNQKVSSSDNIPEPPVPSKCSLRPVNLKTDEYFSTTKKSVNNSSSNFNIVLENISEDKKIRKSEELQKSNLNVTLSQKVLKKTISDSNLTFKTSLVIVDSEYQLGVVNYNQDPSTKTKSSNSDFSLCTWSEDNEIIQTQTDSESLIKKIITSIYSNQSNNCVNVMSVDNIDNPGTLESNKSCKSNVNENNAKYQKSKCKEKYSWQVIDMSSQTSEISLNNLYSWNITNFYDPSKKMQDYSIKYSWQIVSIGTQVSIVDKNNSEYWIGAQISPKKCNGVKKIYQNENNCSVFLKGRNFNIIKQNESTQTCSEKAIQTDFNN